MMIPASKCANERHFPVRAPPKQLTLMWIKFASCESIVYLVPDLFKPIPLQQFVLVRSHVSCSWRAFCTCFIQIQYVVDFDWKPLKRSAQNWIERQFVKKLVSARSTWFLQFPHSSEVICVELSVKKKIAWFKKQIHFRFLKCPPTEKD